MGKSEVCFLLTTQRGRPALAAARPRLVNVASLSGCIERPQNGNSQWEELQELQNGNGRIDGSMHF